MSDDWSLNGLKSNIVHYVDHSVDVPFWFYHEITIETLRQKLIDDIFDFTDDITVVSRQVLIKQINKRFGVDE